VIVEGTAAIAEDTEDTSAITREATIASKSASAIDPSRGSFSLLFDPSVLRFFFLVYFSRLESWFSAQSARPRILCSVAVGVSFYLGNVVRRGT
jgi:hypothetical protein